MSTLIWIDDHLAGVTLRKPILENCGYSVLTARTAQEGLALLSAAPVDGVILDYRLPDMDGETLVRHIRALDSTLPIVVLSRSCDATPDAITDRANAAFTKAQDSFAAVITKVTELIIERKQKA